MKKRLPGVLFHRRCTITNGFLLNETKREKSRIYLFTNELNVQFKRYYEIY